ncbi:MAG: HupE/UreJ family protein, partial [Pedobacter sp.]|nr:HupE/UreJ family protein [Pedobacter sp.]
MAQGLLFLKEGFFHIVSIYSLDHLLFLLALVAIYQLKDWKEILALVTVFTAAHAITLLISILNWITIPNAIIEWLIALTIFYTCIENLYLTK